MKDFEKEMLAKIDAGEKLSEYELRSLCYEYSICDEEGDSGRWTQWIDSIINFDGRYFMIPWQRGLRNVRKMSFTSNRLRSENTLTKRPLK